ncbi:MAG: hypothetical protein ACI31M_01770 [Bacilli bacterium]
MNSIEKTFKRKTVVMVVSVFLISLLVISVSYSSFSNIGTATNNYIVEEYPLTMTYKDNNFIETTLAVSTDESGLKNAGKSFSIINNSNLDVLYHIFIEDVNAISSKDNIKVSIDGEKPHCLKDLEIRNGKIILTSGIVKKSNEVNDVITHNIKMWAINKEEKVNFQISVESETATDVATGIIKSLNNSSEVTPIDSGLLEDAFGNIRYFGESPNNYLKFNNEIWRIVGVFDVSKGDNRLESRVKIVRDSSISSDKYITSSNYSWGENLGLILNDYAVNKIIEEDINLFDYVTYNVGGITTYKNYKATDFYSNELNNKDVLGRENSIVSDCGLLTISDYYYAEADGLSGNWLNNGTEYWLINNNSNNINSAFFVNSEGLVSEDLVSNNHGLRPVVYLKSTVRIVNGDGSLNNPYVIK